MFDFKVIKESHTDKARLGRIYTPHGIIETPAFVFCATKANLKGVTIEHVQNENTQIILSNTYHLMLQPGAEVIKNAGGLHKFSGWKGPMMTDSGGFQIFSLGHGGVTSEIKGSGFIKTNKTMLKITEDGAYFRSYTDGKKVYLTPELSMQVQMDLGADLIVAFDECTPYHVSKLYTAASMEKSKRWGLRSLKYIKAYGNDSQALLAVIQGGVYRDLRRESADFANDNDFFAFAIGGSLGKTSQEMYDIVSMTKEMLDPTRYVHLLGIGGIEDIFHGVATGIDTFDCVSPTRIARHGSAILKRKELATNGLYKKNYLNLCNSKFKEDYSPISKECSCYTCRNFSKSYIHHLIKAKEVLSGTLISIHNIHMMNELLSDIRKGIAEDNLSQIQSDWCGI